MKVKKALVTHQMPLSIKSGDTIKVLDDIKEGEAACIRLSPTGELIMCKLVEE